MNMIKKTAAFVLSAVMLMSALAGCSEDVPGGETTAATTTAAMGETTPPPTTVPPTTVPLDYVPVTTRYGELRYQEMWSEFMVTEMSIVDETVVVKFMAALNGEKYELFDIYIGGDEADPVGLLTDSEGVQRNVYAFIREDPDILHLADDERNQLMAMQEDINYVVQNLK